jgi:hypothetical protein
MLGLRGRLRCIKGKILNRCNDPIEVAQMNEMPPWTSKLNWQQLGEIAAACRRGILIKARSLASIRSILKNGLDRVFLDETSDRQPGDHVGDPDL